MPTHIDVLCGDYKSTLEWNLRAIEVNEKYVAREGRVGFYALYHTHDRHIAIYGAMFLGRSRVALGVAADLEASLPEELLRIEQPPMADYLRCARAPSTRWPVPRTCTTSSHRTPRHTSPSRRAAVLMLALSEP